jgi:phosphocarrier protein HPr
MSDMKLSRDVVVANTQGLHARPANLIMKLANQYQSQIELIKGNERVDGKSILEILTLGATPGTTLVIEATGPDAEAAVEALATLFASKFAEVENET